MRYQIISYLILILGIIGITPSQADDDDHSNCIFVQYADARGGGGDYLPLKALAHTGSIGTERLEGKVLSNVVICDYTVSKDIKSVTAKYTICKGDLITPFSIKLELPILPYGSVPIKSDVGEGFSAYAVIIKKP